MSRILRNMLAGVSLIVLSCGIAASGQPIPVPVGNGTSYSAWPVNIQDGSGVIQVFEPQPDKLEGDQLTARAAVSLRPRTPSRSSGLSG